MRNPYSSLEDRALWRKGVADVHPTAYTDLYRKKFNVSPSMRIATAGSCFAQHIASSLRGLGYTVIDREPPPHRMSKEAAVRYGFMLYSGRYGNIYTVRQLLQLVEEAFGEVPREGLAWERNGRFYDALRPTIEPNGFASEKELYAIRKHHLRRVRKIFTEADLFIFTMGLTECWADRRTGVVYPVAPGVVAGEFDPDRFELLNLHFQESYDDFLKVRDKLRSINPNIKFLLTVSPVPLTATATRQHVLVATTYSKSVLRAVAGQLATEFADIDYFPAYEIIATHPARGFFYDANLRTVSSAGVSTVMKVFFSQHKPVIDERKVQQELSDVVCDEELLEVSRS